MRTGSAPADTAIRPRIDGQRFLGIDVGSENIKVAELVRRDGVLACTRTLMREHGKQPASRLLEILRELDWGSVAGAAACGRMSRQLRLAHVPQKQAQTRGYRLLHGDGPATIISIGNRGFTVLELRANGLEVFRENGRCSQGTGNFLRQLVGRFSLDIAEASELAADVQQPAALSGRCPVILKTDMTHLANKGERREQILAGLFDAVCENVMTLVKPGVNPGKVLLIGGVSQSRRVQDTFHRLLEGVSMELAPFSRQDALFLEAVGAAVVAAEGDVGVPSLDQLLAQKPAARFERVAPLGESLPRVRRMAAAPPQLPEDASTRLVLGFDIGSTGSKLVALDAASGAAAWEGYRPTSGDPVGAAQDLLGRYLEAATGRYAVTATGVTGSGREIVGSLLATCFGKDAVYILNEIAAHAEGAVRYDARVDTIFEIGGQDAKYIRLAQGRVVDCAMNEACSAGTGSFIEEQGRKFPGIRDVVHLGEEAIRAAGGVSLGQHCSVFMAEVVDEATDAGEKPEWIIAGLYDSIIKNYLNRVKGNRPVGNVIFCQGMPFSSDALAAAVARQTGSEVIIPPSPGTVGALGIALIAARELPWAQASALDMSVFLGASILSKETFNCKANVGCGGAGNKCRIDSISTLVAGRKQRFTWGGGCSLWDKGTRKKKLPDRSPDPFREREQLVDDLLQRLAAGGREGRPRVAFSDEFMLKGLFPFFATFIDALGLEPVVSRGADHQTLKRGVQQANLCYCAPMQLYHGLASTMADSGCDYIFAPMIRSVQRLAGQTGSWACPIAQACPDILRWDLQHKLKAVFASPVINMGQNGLDSEEFVESCRATAAALGRQDGNWRAAYRAARAAQSAFDEACIEIGRRAMDFCRERGVTPVVVVGRPYTIYNRVLNSNVPALLREQGALAVPVDCYPVDGGVPVFGDIYWGYGQRLLRAAHQVRREQGVYAIFCSNYACGPDSFNLHFFSYIMEGKPFAIIETDGHAGDAGTKTRVEAFLYCVNQDLRGGGSDAPMHDLSTTRIGGFDLGSIPKSHVILLPKLGLHTDIVAACMRGMGYQSEVLPDPDPVNLQLGRRHTSGKECSPMILTAGSLLQWLQEHDHPDLRAVLFMPRTPGPCRFGVYNILNTIITRRLGFADRITIASPPEHEYFANAPAGFLAIAYTGFMAADLLLGALHEARAWERTPGTAAALYERHTRHLLELCRERVGGDLSLAATAREVLYGRLYGVPELLENAASEFAAIRTPCGKPRVLVVGEFYVRCMPFANDFVIDKLEERGCRVKLAPVSEWLEYVDHNNWTRRGQRGIANMFKIGLKSRIRHRTYSAIGPRLGWPPHEPVSACLAAARPYLRDDLEGEAAVTLGSALHEWRAGRIDGAVSVGPLECMPNKVAEAQFFHIAEQEGLPTLTIPLMGDPMNLTPLDNFVFELKNRPRSSPGTSHGSGPSSFLKDRRPRGRGLPVSRR